MEDINQESIAHRQVRRMGPLIILNLPYRHFRRALHRLRRSWRLCVTPMTTTCLPSLPSLVTHIHMPASLMLRPLGKCTNSSERSWRWFASYLLSWRLLCVFPTFQVTNI